MIDVNTSGGFSADEACAWCAVMMRRNGTWDSQALCLDCYFRMLRKEGQAAKVRSVSVLDTKPELARAAGGSST